MVSGILTLTACVGGSKDGRKRAFDGQELVLAVALDFSPVQKVLTPVLPP